MKILTLLFLVIGLNLFAADMREDFHKGMFSEDELNKIVSSKEYSNSILNIVYKGVCYTMLADYQFFPTSKLSYFNDGKALIEAAIKKEANNVELRYLRLLVQLNCPGFLGYGDDIEADLNYFNTNLHSYKVDEKWKKIFIENLIAGEQLSTAQKNKLLLLKKKYA